MSKLSEKAKGIDLNLDDDSTAAVPVAVAPTDVAQPVFHGETPRIAKERSRTGIGMVGRALTAERELRDENDALKGRIQKLEEGGQVLSLDPRKVHATRYANRHETAFSRLSFATLKEEIATSGGNVQPIKVRPKQDAPGEFEVIFGHRRHRACLELGLPVLSMIEDVGDQELFVQMDRENRERQDLSPWEQGVMYKRALDMGLFPSLRQLAAATGVSPGHVAKALGAADLPEAVIEAFASPLDIQFRWAALLKEALERDATGVVDRARQIAGKSPKPEPKHVLEALLSEESEGGGEITPIEVAGKTIGEFKLTKSGGVQVKFRAGALNAAQLAKLRKVVQQLAEK